MKKLIAIAAVASIFAGFGAVDSADAGSKYKYKYKYQSKYGNNHNHNYKFGKVFRPQIVFPAPVVFHAPPVIVAPACTYVIERVWIAPVYQDVISGYDSCGNPVYHQVVVTPGCYRNAKYKVFPNGAREFVCYL